MTINITATGEVVQPPEIERPEPVTIGNDVWLMGEEIRHGQLTGWKTLLGQLDKPEAEPEWAGRGIAARGTAYVASGGVAHVQGVAGQWYRWDAAAGQWADYTGPVPPPADPAAPPVDPPPAGKLVTVPSADGKSELRIIDGSKYEVWQLHNSFERLE